MSSKNSRHSTILRNSDQNISEEHWLKQFQKNLKKDAVQPRTEESFFDQINSIMNGSKSKHTSVQAAVDDMKERSGLTAYLDKVKVSKEQNNNKIASDTNESFDKKVKLEPVVIKKFPSIRNTLENYITDTKGNLPVPAIIEKIKSIHQSDVSDAKDWEDEDLIKLVSDMNLDAKKSNPSLFHNETNLGKYDESNGSDSDPSNTDAFYSLNPVKF